MKRIGVFVALVFSLLLLMSTACAAAVYPQLKWENSIFNQQITPYYLYTNDITASLSFDGNKAKCGGSVSPSGNDSVSVTVTLYQQNGSGWRYMDSWSGNASGGSAAVASGSATVGNGTYKVVTSGNVGGKEFPTKSVIRTKK